MSLRNVTLTAVAALSLGMAANAQTTTITVPMGEPGATAPATTAPGTTVTVTGGQQTVETTGAADRVATPATPAPAAGAAESAASAETGTAATDMAVTTPTATATTGEPPAAPMEGLPAASTEAQVNAPVPAASDAVTAADTPTAADAAPGGTVAGQQASEELAPTQSADQPEAEEVAQDAAAPVAADTAIAETPAAEQAPADQTTEAPAPVAADGETPHQVEQAAAADAAAAGHATHQEIHDVRFSFEGPFGKYDQFQLQRGLQVYTEVCAACHGMKFVPLRTLADPGGPGLPEDQVRAYAAAMSVFDPELDEERPRIPTDMFPTVAGDGMGPDLSLMAKARAGFHGPYGTGLSQLVNGIGGPEYIYSILTGYTGEEREQAGTIFYENHAFPGGWISMPPPLSDDQVTFEDGAPADLHSAAKDLSAFLMWAAEPKMMDRKQVGLVSVLFLIVLAALLYLTNKRIWWPIKHRDDVIGDGR